MAELPVDLKFCFDYYNLGITLNHLPLDKMVTILQVTFSYAFSEKVQFFTKISLKFVPKGPIDNNPALVQIMV